MRSTIAQYLNEIVSLTVLGLMCIALVAGQAGAAQMQTANSGETVPKIEIIETADRAEVLSFLENRFRLVEGPELEIDLTFRFRHTGE